MGGSFLNRAPELYNFLRKEEPHLLALQDTGLFDNDEHLIHLPPNYTIVINAPNLADIHEIKQRSLIAQLEIETDYVKKDNLRKEIQKHPRKCQYPGTLAIIYRTDSFAFSISNLQSKYENHERIQIMYEQHHNIYFVNTYIPPSAKKAKILFTKLSKLIDNHIHDKPYILLGDFNAVLDPIDKLSNAPLHTRDKLYRSLLHNCGLTEAYTQSPIQAAFSFYKNGPNNTILATRIDHILISTALINSLSSHPSAILDDWSSLSADHLPVQSILYSNLFDGKSANPLPNSTRTFLDLKKMGTHTIEEFQKTLSEKKIEYLTAFHDENSTTSEKLDLLHKIISDNLPLTTKPLFKPSPPPQPDKNIKTLINDLVRIRKSLNGIIRIQRGPNFTPPSVITATEKLMIELHTLNHLDNTINNQTRHLSLHNPLLLKALIALKKKTQIKLEKAKSIQLSNTIRQKVQKIHSNYVHDIGKMYAQVKNRHSKHKKHIAQVRYSDANGRTQTSNNPIVIKQKFSEHWGKIFSAPISTSHLENDDPPWLKEPILPRIPDTMSNSLNIHEFSMETLSDTLKSMKAGKSTYDGIPVEAYKWLPPYLQKILLSLLNKIIQGAEMPKSWKISGLHLIGKKGDLLDPGNYRPIALVHTQYKILSTMVKNELNSLLNTTFISTVSGPFNLLSPNQNGFRNRRMCTQSVRTLRNLMDQALLEDLPIYIAYLDIKKAFDSVNHAILLRTLRAINLPHYLINFVDKTYQNRHAEIWLPQGKVSIKLESGVLQGCPLSPILFNLFTDPFLKWLNKTNLGIHFQDLHIPALTFADDKVFLSRSSTSLQAILDMETRFSNFSSLSLSISDTAKSAKTVCTSHEPTHSTQGTTVSLPNYTQPQFTIQNKKIPYLKSNEYYKYMGFNISILDTDFSHHKRMTMATYLKRLSSIRKSCYTTQQRIAIVNKLFIPRIQYTMNIAGFTKEELHVADKCALSLVNCKAGIQRLTNFCTFLPIKYGGRNLSSLKDTQIAHTLASFLDFYTNEIEDKWCQATTLYLLEKLQKHSYPQYKTTILNILTMAKQQGLELKINPFSKSTSINWTKIHCKNIQELNEFISYQSHDIKSIRKDLTDNYLFIPASLSYSGPEDHIYLYTDGSCVPNLDPNKTKASMAIYAPKLHPSSLSLAVSNPATIYHAELMALAIAIGMAPINTTCTIISDSLSAIQTLNQYLKNTKSIKINKTPHIHLLKIALHSYNRRKKPLFIKHIYSHLRDKIAALEKLGEPGSRKIKEIRAYLSAEFGENYAQHINGNNTADDLARIAIDLSPARNPFTNLPPLSQFHNNVTIHVLSKKSQYTDNFRDYLKQFVFKNRLVVNKSTHPRLHLQVNNPTIYKKSTKFLKVKMLTKAYLQDFFYKLLTSKLRTLKNINIWIARGEFFARYINSEVYSRIPNLCPWGCQNQEDDQSHFLSCSHSFDPAQNLSNTLQDLVAEHCSQNNTIFALTLPQWYHGPSNNTHHLVFDKDLGSAGFIPLGLFTLLKNNLVGLTSDSLENLMSQIQKAILDHTHRRWLNRTKIVRISYNRIDASLRQNTTPSPISQLPSLPAGQTLITQYFQIQPSLPAGQTLITQYFQIQQTPIHQPNS